MKALHLLLLLLAGLLVAAPPARAQISVLADDDGQLFWPTSLIIPTAGGLTLGGVFRSNWPSATGAVVTNLADVQDVTFSGLANYDLFYYDSGTTHWKNLPTTAAGRALLQAVDAAAQRTALGLGTAATSASSAFEPAGVSSSDITDSTSAGRTLITAADAAAQRTALGLGTAATSASSAFQAADSDLTDLASNGSTGTGAFVREGASPTFTQVTTPLLIATNVQHTTTAGTGTNLVWDLQAAETTISPGGNLVIASTTNRPSSSAYVVYRTLIITGTNADLTLTIPTNWTSLTTNYSRIPSNGIVLIAGRWSSTEGSGIVAIKAQEGK